MSWVKLDDRFFDNPKIAPLSDGAQLAYLKATTYSARELTDGFVALKKAKEYGSPKVIKELVPSLWEPCDGGFMVHDYLKYNPTRAQVLAERDAAKKRMQGARSGDVRANSGGTSGEVHPSPVDPLSPIPEGDVKHPLPNPVSHSPHPVPIPSREVVVGFEKCFGRLLSPMELEEVKALEDEQPKERIEFALREAAALNKRSVRYVQRTCERIGNDDGSESSRGFPNARKDPDGVADRVSGLDRRSAAIAKLGRGSG